MKLMSIKAEVKLDKSLWVVLFEKIDHVGYTVARALFGSEPTDPEIYQYILTNFNSLKFSSPRDIKLIIKRKNPKRVQREIRNELKKIKSNHTNLTLAQEVLRIELEKNKKEKKAKNKQDKQYYLQQRFLLKKTKKKQKKRGH